MADPEVGLSPICRNRIVGDSQGLRGAAVMHSPQCGFEGRVQGNVLLLLSPLPGRRSGIRSQAVMGLSLSIRQMPYHGSAGHPEGKLRTLGSAGMVYSSASQLHSSTPSGV